MSAATLTDTATDERSRTSHLAAGPPTRPAMCFGCLWTGRRLWPSPVKPCPQCGSRDVRRRTGPKRIPRHEQTSPSYWTEWAS